MGTTLNDIITLSITRETKPVSKASFAVPIILGENFTFSDATRIKFYTDLDSLASDLTGGTGDPEYKAAESLFSQNPRVTRFAGGKKIGADTDYTDTLNGIVTVSKDFYGVVLTSRTLQDQKDVADWVQSNKRVFVTASADTNIIDQADGVDVTTIAWYIKSNSYDRSMCIYSGGAATKYADAAFLGTILPKTPGSYTGKFKTLSGVTVDNLTTTQAKNAHDKYCSTYEEVGEQNIVLDSWVGTGEFIDITIFADWVEAEVKTEIFGTLVNEDKVPGTDEGITTIQNDVSAALQRGIDNGGFSPKSFDSNKVQNGGYVVSVPLNSSRSDNDKNLRFLDNVEFTGWLAGALHKVAIQGVITV